jgi:hypothetical protein
VGGAQLEVGTYPTSLIVTTSTATARNADAVSATVPAVPAKWCVAVTAKPEEGRAWANLANIWLLGSGAPVLDYTYVSATAGFVVGSNTKTFTSADQTLVAGSSHRLVTCGNPTGRSLAIDGVTKALVEAGAAFSTSYSTTLNIGASSVGGTPFGGFLKDLRIYSAKSFKEAK